MKTKIDAPLVPLILSGGSGTRLWPMSRELTPKQFLPLVTHLSLLQETLRRAQSLGAFVQRPIIVCNEAHRFLVAEQARAISIEPRAIVLEPAGRNTAPAVAAGALLAESFATDPLLLVLPADHVILDTAAFAAAITAAIAAAREGRLVTFGVVPDKPETGYGYIARGEDHGGWHSVERFVEKPDLRTAQGYVDSGRYYWNSGMFLFAASTFLRELAGHAPAMVDPCRRAVAGAAVDADFTRLGQAFLESPSNSIDYAVMEKTERAAVVPLAAGWSDVGSWPALHDVLPKDASGNVAVGDVLLEQCTRSYVASSGRTVAVIGLDAVVVIETADAVLVMARDNAQDVTKVVKALQKRRPR
jgi:mannose-1-phosphate guanylyltransferase / mannose-6-phosphate isomerase